MTNSPESEMYPEDEEVSSPEPEDLEAHQEYREIAPSTQQATTVIEAIHTATADRRYTLLLEIVTALPAAKKLAEERLLLSISGSSQPSLKRKAYETCENCEVEYAVESNYKGACVYHEGNKEVDYDSDMWADHDERCHGDPESLADDPTYEEGFLWNCCKKDVRAEGCVVSKHVPNKSDPVALKRVRTVLAPVSANANANASAAASFRGPGGRNVIDIT